MSYFQLLYTYGGSDRDATGCWRNVSGAPVVIASKIARASSGDRTPTAGVYRFRLETASAVSCRRISLQDTRNPLIYSGTRSITADRQTENDNLLPGWSFVFRDDVQAGDEFEVGIGCYWDPTLGSWIRITSFGTRMSGLTSSARILKVKNISPAPLTECKLVATNAIRVENISGQAFSAFYQTGILNPESDSDLSGALVTFTNLGAGSPPTVDMLVGGAPVDVYEDSFGLVPGGKGLQCDGTTRYRFADETKYQSGSFILSETLSEGDTASIHVSDGGTSVWVAGMSGSLVSGPSGMVLTEAGRTAGTIAAGGEVDFKLSVQPPEGATSDLNARSFSLRAVGLSGSTVVELEHQGSFVVTQGQCPLSMRISAVKEAYPRPRYSPDPENPDSFEPDPDGEYVEDLSSPGSYIHYSAAADSGSYRNIWQYLAENGVTIFNVP